MKALHINAGNMYGGVETVLVTMARCRGLCPELEPSFAVCYRGRLSEELAAAGAPVYDLGATRVSRPWTLRTARTRLGELLREQKFDVVVCHMSWNHAIFGPEVKRAGKPLVYWAHGPASGEGWLERWASRCHPDLAICNSRFTAEALPNLFPDVASKVIYLPVDFQQYSPGVRSQVRREMGLAEEDVVVLQASRMEACKGHVLHLEALAKLKNVPDWTCWFAGGAQRESEVSFLERLKEKAVELGIGDRVRFLGQRSDVPQLMRAADIFCQPNQTPDAFGLVFVEALWAGIPVITSRIGGAVEVIDDSCGYLLPPGEPELLAETLRRLIESPDDRAALGRLGPAKARALCDPGGRLSELLGALMNVGDRMATYA